LEILSNTQITKAAMNKTTLLLLAFAVSLPLAAADVTTTSGRSFKNCTVLQVNPDGVTFRHSKGLARVLFSDMTPSAQKAFGYDADKEADYRKQQAEERAQKRELARQQAEAAAKAYAAAQQAAMENRTHRALQTAALLQAVVELTPWAYRTTSRPLTVATTPDMDIVLATSATLLTRSKATRTACSATTAP
jgi:hypothetical protein